MRGGLRPGFYNTIHRSILIVACLAIVSGCGETRSAIGVVREATDPRVEPFLQDMLVEEHFTGAVLVARGGKTIHAKGYGPASQTTDNDVATAFHVASLTKQFTAAATMQLVEKGILDLAVSINRYLPEKYTTPTWEAVTAHHLLSHSSGIPDYAVTRDYYDVIDGFCLGDTVDGMILEAMASDLEFSPGSRYQYSNIGFTLLGLIIENQTGAAYEEYMQDEIFEPMGMTASRIHVEGHVPATNEADGLRWSEELGGHVPDDVVSLPVTAPDGGLVTTLGDLLTWSQIYSGSARGILDQSSIDQMTSLQIRIGRGGAIDGYGYGLGIGDRLIGHTGYIVGFRSQFVFDRRTGTLILVLTNNTSNDPRRIAFGLLTILLAAER